MEILEMNLMEHTEFSLLRLKFFLAWLETFFSWKCAMTLSSSSKLCTELSQNYWEAARVNERDVSAVVYGAPRSEVGTTERRTKNSASEVKMNKRTISFSRKFYQFIPVNVFEKRRDNSIANVLYVRMCIYFREWIDMPEYCRNESLMFWK